MGTSVRMGNVIVFTIDSGLPEIEFTIELISILSAPITGGLGITHIRSGTQAAHVGVTAD
jgi:hypothetical protein